MSRRDAGAARQEARHARDRLQSTLGGSLLLTGGSGEPFEYDGGTHLSADGPDPGVGGEAGNGTGKTGPSLRWRIGFRAALLIGALAVLAGAWFWWQVGAGKPEVVPLSDISTQDSGSADPGALPDNEPEGPDPPGAGGMPGVVIIHVAGAVVTPGVVQLPAGSRVHQAVAAAGGGTAAADLNRLNLAAVLTDGEKLYVPQAGEQVPTGQSGPGAQPSGGDGGSGVPREGKVNLNTAGIEELDALPKVGPVLAQRIVDWRKEHGPFKAVEELDAVDGVGAKMLETLLPLVGI
ncbi:ComEA family DNA-binding protein [Arthrobacter sp. HMWF013]|uniref:ComEA family DNA-binding protein n=1 Tax=Arthrobacter sp. HMWF013 TaxID=2056849 RepID=UPI000D3944EA|nr:ComEA family DNA-binding protein [Arthrobacter sp. HMWF013]PTT68469.1 competence protein ComEA [Arthrobacter sp. HMWF013]